ncbi:tRNA (adenine(22)-N(1))-methyltransferase [Streptococcus caviae]|uniref:tRNA (adenine(22)-N(1))-methyltransferase n=1 Tax=Streptococcus sp. 'caviae' TaxID=1915004 RepID=UPI00094BB020|nr:tRNA (adenine(22)-N(1))-methyltransferase TrmK [Streptococcus sp. 'caviae']OLN84280.1 tRNA (adenine-N(1))-methyltransferase [Streptococcus sp. 'caviae']
MEDNKKGISLSERLQEIAGFVPQGARLLDVGSDHAYLPLYLLEKGWIDYAIAGEVAKGPYSSAAENVDQAGLSERVDVRLADGLAAFTAVDKIDVITICGMGGRLIAEILEAGKAKLALVEQLILQPNNCEDELRLWLMANGFAITAEKMVADKQKYYEILVAEKGQMTLSDLDLRFGPCLRQELSAVFKARWQKELSKLEQALMKIPETNEQDRQAVKAKISQIKEVLHESTADY